MEPKEKIHVTAVILAGGRGNRMNSDIPKQYLTIHDRPVLYYSLKAFSEHPMVEHIVLVTGAGEEEYCRKEIVERYRIDKVSAIVAGGAERFDSVQNGLKAVSDRLSANQNGRKTGSDRLSTAQNSREAVMNGSDVSSDSPVIEETATERTIVMIHDGARPCVTREIIDRAIEGVIRYGACVSSMPVKDTIKIADEEGFADSTPDRSRLWLIQTPQSFDLELIQSAYEAFRRDPEHFATDDAMLVERYTDRRVKLVLGDYRNIKITTPEDMILAEAFLHREDQ